MGKKIAQGVLALLGVLLLMGIFGSSSKEAPGPTEGAAVELESEDPAPSPTVQVPSPTDESTVEPPAEVPSPTATKTASEPRITVAQENAIEKADDYLSFAPFSRSGLIDQLEYEGFSTKDATFAVDYLDVNWNQQAAKKAQDYLDFSAFSRTGLIEQLIYEGFTRDQAVFGVDSVGL